jgi:hypothetical protein
MPNPVDDGVLRAAGEIAAAAGAALIAAWVRSRNEPSAWTLRALLGRVAEAVVCGFLAVGIAGFLGWSDPRTTVGLSAGLSLLGTGALADLILKFASKKADG